MDRGLRDEVALWTRRTPRPRSSRTPPTRRDGLTRPWRPHVRHGKGQALYHLGRFEEALAAYEQALKLPHTRPLMVATWRVQAMALRAIGRDAQAQSIESRVEYCGQVRDAHGTE
jgi:tetratricopeptide (TPR) repeat protein